MIVGAQQILGTQSIPAVAGQAPRLSHTRDTGYVVGTPLPEPAGDGCGATGKQAQPQTFGFLLVMAALSVAREVGVWALGDLQLSLFGVALDPFAQLMVLQLLVSLVGTGVAAGFSKWTPDPAARRHVLVTLVAALGIGLLLALLGYLFGTTSTLFWLIVPVYLLWAWAEAVSGPIVPVASAPLAKA
jgi:hypothetical protein